MSMCKGCGEVVSFSEMKNGYCKKCSISTMQTKAIKNEEKTQAEQGTNISLSTQEKIFFTLAFIIFIIHTYVSIALIVQFGFDFETLIVLPMLVSLINFYYALFLLKTNKNTEKIVSAIHGMFIVFVITYIYFLMMFIGYKQRYMIGLTVYFAIVFPTMLYIASIIKKHLEWIGNYGFFIDKPEKTIQEEKTDTKIIKKENNKAVENTSSKSHEEFLNQDIADELNHYHKLFKDNVITEEEFQTIKKKLIQKI